MASKRSLRTGLRRARALHEGMAMKHGSISFTQFFKQLSRSVSKNQTFDLGAQLAYWSLLSLFPFAMFLLTIMGYMPLHGLDRELMSFVYSAMPKDAAKLIEST